MDLDIDTEEDRKKKMRRTLPLEMVNNTMLTKVKTYKPNPIEFRGYKDGDLE